MEQKIYIETSVVSYYTGRASRDVVIAGHQQVTQDFWMLLSGDLSPYISALVVDESGKGNVEMAKKRLAAIDTFPVIPTTSAAEQLAGVILENHGIPKEYPEDALHISIAAMAGMDSIATWNFTHINNPFTKLKIRRIVEYAGFECPEIVSPEAFVGGKR
jgi:predicted nucleic acid-binding protein